MRILGEDHRCILAIRAVRVNETELFRALAERGITTFRAGYGPWRDGVRLLFVFAFYRNKEIVETLEQRVYHDGAGVVSVGEKTLAIWDSHREARKYLRWWYVRLTPFENILDVVGRR